MPHLLSEFRLRDIALPNRIGVSPMCQYSSVDGYATDWHLFISGRAVGGAGLVFAEAAAVAPEGRISPQDLGMWREKHIEPLARIARFIDSQGSVAGIQLAHAGRKASVARPWWGRRRLRRTPAAGVTWSHPAPSRFGEDYPMPTALTPKGSRRWSAHFATAARRALEAGFRAIEIHAAHGYLLHEFLSPLSNLRTDGYGGSFANRSRIVRETVEAMRAHWPEPLAFVRADFGDGLDRGRMGRGAVRRTGAHDEAVSASIWWTARREEMSRRRKIPMGPGYHGSNLPSASDRRREYSPGRSA